MSKLNSKASQRRFRKCKHQWKRFGMTLHLDDAEHYSVRCCKCKLVSQRRRDRDRKRKASQCEAVS